MIDRIADWLGRTKESLALWVFLLATPALYFACFPPFGVNEAAFVFLVPFAIWLRFAPSLRLVFLASAAVGWVAWIVLIFWLRHVTAGGMLLLALLMGLHFALWALAVAWLQRRCRGNGVWSSLPVTVGAASFWVAVEQMRGLVFSGFPWLPLAASQADRPMMLQGASIFGSWGLSFALALLNFGTAAYLLQLVEYAKRRERKRQLCPDFYIALSFLVGTTFVLLRLSSGQEREDSLRAGVVQPDIAQVEKWDADYARDILQQVSTATQWLAPLEPDAVFWPETTLPYPLNDEGAMEAWTIGLATQIGAPLFVGAMGIEGEQEDWEWFNSVFLARPEHGLFPLYYSKQHLVPFGEYIPLRPLWPWIEKVVPIQGDIKAGAGTQLLPLYLEESTLKVGTLICFEDVFPGIARKAVKQGASLLFVATNSAWYGRSAAADQHKLHSVLRAVETRRPVLRVGNDGWTGWIDEYGSERDALDPWEQASTVWTISRDRRWIGRESFYVRWGDWFAAVCWLVSAGCAWLAWRWPAAG